MAGKYFLSILTLCGLTHCSSKSSKSPSDSTPFKASSGTFDESVSSKDQSVATPTPEPAAAAQDLTVITNVTIQSDKIVTQGECVPFEIKFLNAKGQSAKSKEILQLAFEIDNGASVSIYQKSDCYGLGLEGNPYVAKDSSELQLYLLVTEAGNVTITVKIMDKDEIATVAHTITAKEPPPDHLYLTSKGTEQPGECLEIDAYTMNRLGNLAKAPRELVFVVTHEVITDSPMSQSTLALRVYKDAHCTELDSGTDSNFSIASGKTNASFWVKIPDNMLLQEVSYYIHVHTLSSPSLDGDFAFDVGSSMNGWTLW